MTIIELRDWITEWIDSPPELEMASTEVFGLIYGEAIPLVELLSDSDGIYLDFGKEGWA